HAVAWRRQLFARRQSGKGSPARRRAPGVDRVLLAAGLADSGAVLAREHRRWHWRDAAVDRARRIRARLAITLGVSECGHGSREDVHSSCGVDAAPADAAYRARGAARARHRGIVL